MINISNQRQKFTCVVVSDVSKLANLTVWREGYGGAHRAVAHLGACLLHNDVPGKYCDKRVGRIGGTQSGHEVYIREFNALVVRCHERFRIVLNRILDPTGKYKQIKL